MVNSKRKNVVKNLKCLLFDILQYLDNILERNKDLRGNNISVSGIMKNINNNGEGEREKIIMEFSFLKEKSNNFLRNQSKITFVTRSISFVGYEGQRYFSSLGSQEERKM